MSRSSTSTMTKRTVERHDVDSVEWQNGSVVNMSTRGACIVDDRAMSSLAPGVVETIRFASEGRMLSLRARVVWTRKPSASEGTLAGLEFLDVSAKETVEIEQLAKFGFADPERAAERAADTSVEDEAGSICFELGKEVIDLYGVLGIRPDASEADIRAAFRKGAARWHPDTCESAEAASRFMDITKAYKVLRDARTRDMYDSMLRRSEASKAPAESSNSDRRDKGRLRCADIRCSLGEIVNASCDGLQVIGRKRFGHKRGKKVRLTLQDGSERMELTAEIAWLFDVGMGKRRMGLHLQLENEVQQRTYWNFIRGSAQVASSIFTGQSSGNRAA